MLFHFYRIAPKKDILKQWEYWPLSWLSSQSVWWLQLETLCLLCTFGKWIYKLLLQFHSLLFMFWLQSFFSPLFSCVHWLLCVLFDVLFTLQFLTWKAKMHLCFSDTQRICVCVCVCVCIYVHVRKECCFLERSQRFQRCVCWWWTWSRKIANNMDYIS